MSGEYNYIKLINRFWAEVEMKDFLPSEACVYFRLLDICNRLGWQNPFSLSNSRVVVLMALNDKTFRAIRDKLAERGLIQFRKGKRNSSKPMYCLPIEVDGEWIFPWDEDSNEAPGQSGVKVLQEFLPSKNTAKPAKNPENSADKILQEFLPVKNTANTPANTPAKTPAKTPANTPAYNKTININQNDDDARARERTDGGRNPNAGVEPAVGGGAIEWVSAEEVVADFFSEKRLKSLQAFCMKQHTDVDNLRELADEILTEWSLTNAGLHKDMKDGLQHLMSAMKIKLNIQRDENSKARQGPRFGSKIPQPGGHGLKRRPT